MPEHIQQPADKPAPAGNKFDINAPKLVLEFLSVLLGVLLAFAASEWQEERERIDRAEKALAGVYHELDQNTTLLRKIHDNNRATVAAMAEDGDSDEERSFIPGLQLQSIAWESIKSTGIGPYIPYQTMLLLSRCYAILDVYIATGQSLTESSLTVAALATVMEKEIDNQVFQKQFGAFFGMIVDVEDALLSCADRSMDYLNREHALSIK